MAKNMIFHDFLKFVQIIIKGHPRYVEMFWGSERPFPSPDRIFEHFRPYGRPYREKSKIRENRKNRDFGQNFDF